MNKREAIEWFIDELRGGKCSDDCPQCNANEIALNCIKAIGHLKDRPCSVCEFHKESGCCKWNCVFDEVIYER